MNDPASLRSSPRRKSEDRCGDMLRDAFFHQLHGDDASAIKLYRNVLDRDPGSAKALLGMGKILIEAGQKEKAEKLWVRAARCESLDATTAHYLSHVLRQFSPQTDSRWCARMAVELAPDDATFNYNLGALLANSGLVYEAKEYLERALRLRPGNLDIIRRIGQLGCSDFVFAARAIEVVAPMVERHPGDMDLLNILAKLYWVNLQFADAAVTFHKCHLEADTDVFDSLLFALSLKLSKKHGRAEQAFDELVEVCGTLGANLKDEGRKVRHTAFTARVLACAGRSEESVALFRSNAAGKSPADFEFGEDIYLPRTMERVDRMRKIVRGRDIAIMAHGPSLKDLQSRMHELGGRDICYFGMNRFSAVDAHMLAPIGAEQEVVAVTPPQKINEMMPTIRDFLRKPSANMLITCRGTLDALEAPNPTREAFERAFDEKLLYYSAGGQTPASYVEPLQVLASNTLAVLLPLAALAGPRRIFILGADGGVQWGDHDHTHFGQETKEFNYRLPDEIECRYADLIAADTLDFNLSWEASVNALCILHGVARPPIYNVSPDSRVDIHPKISFDEFIDFVNE